MVTIIVKWIDHFFDKSINVFECLLGHGWLAFYLLFKICEMTRLKKNLKQYVCYGYTSLKTDEQVCEKYEAWNKDYSRIKFFSIYSTSQLKYRKAGIIFRLVFVYVHIAQALRSTDWHNYFTAQ